mmetsp:Transcript_42053/g.98003  ORF Transcript_42053/g.98003 Transcript_42053/m.98003 type:complete len:267 (+) Transcript_42053:33-833(+)
MSPRPNLWPAVKAISLDVSTLLTPRHPAPEIYAASAAWAKLPSAPSAQEFRPALEKALQAHRQSYPCFGHEEGWSSREWWASVVKATLANCGRKYPEADTKRFVRRVYQHYGSSDAFEELPESKRFLEWARQQGLSVGVTTNEDLRMVETVLPMLELHDFFRWFVSAQEVGHQKPDPWIYVEAWREASFWVDGLRREEILHIGESYEEDFLGARGAGMQAILLDRGHSELKEAEVGPKPEDAESWTLRDLGEVQELLQQGIIQQLR